MIRHLYFYTKMLKHQTLDTDYAGEFGYELISVIPFAYYLHTKGKLGHTTSSILTKPLYYFSTHHTEKHQKRSHALPNCPLKNIHTPFLSKLMWAPPPYKEVYKNNELVFDKPLLIISNKFTSEWGFPPIHFYSNEALKKLFSLLKDDFQIVYSRFGAKEIIDDGVKDYRLNDFDWIPSEFPEVILIQDLVTQYSSQYNVNELQLRLYANADRFISVQGGGSVLASYFGGKNIIFAPKNSIRTSSETAMNVFNRWYHRFAGTKITHAHDYDCVYEEASRWVEERIQK